MLLGSRWIAWLAASASLALASLALHRSSAAREHSPVSIPERELAPLLNAERAPASPVDFALEIRPLFSDRCFSCHGQDERARKASLRLDREDVLAATLASGERAIVAGDAEHSEVWRRISSGDDDERMPPVSSGKLLSERERALVRRWIEEGARWAPHWSFRRVERPAIPASSSWCKNPIDAFVARRLEREGLAPSPEESPARLLRRVTLSLTGLPPSLEELETFLRESREDPERAYEHAVDRLLASKRYAEQMTRQWLDLARYGDTHGLHLDNERSLWPWRDWVLRAFDANMPFDRFTIEQNAGDLLVPPAKPLQAGEREPVLSIEDTDKLVATGFQRCNTTTGEGGSIDEESLTRYAVDRVATTSTVWLGLSMACAQCHDHRFDPLSQRDYYAFYGFFSNFDERGSDENTLAPPPVVPVPSASQRAELERLSDERRARETELVAPDPAMDAEELEWRTSWTARLAARWTTVGDSASSTQGTTLTRLDDGSFLASGRTPDADEYVVRATVPAGEWRALSLETLRDASLPRSGPGRYETNGNFVLSEVELTLLDGARRLELERGDAEFAQPGFPIGNAIDGDPATGWGIDFGQGDRRATFALARTLVLEEPAELEVRLRFATRFPRHSFGRFRVALAEDPAFQASELATWEMSGPYRSESDGGESASDLLKKALPPELEKPTEPVVWRSRPDLAEDRALELQGEVRAFYFRRTIVVPSARSLELGFGSDDALAVWVDGERVLLNDARRVVERDADVVRVTLEAGRHTLLAKVVNDRGGGGFRFRVLREELGGLPLEVADALTGAEPSNATALRAHFRTRHSVRGREIERALAQTRVREEKLDAEIPRSMVVRERAERRPLRVLERGQYDKPGASVTRALPAFLVPNSGASEPTRLDLARWLVSRENPLTARVAVNRWWLQHFGLGLVESAEDFGAQGTPPSNPELLDWLAAEFMESGWDVKHVQRLIVTSATYRQSANASAAAWQRDPQNRLLARGPRLRLDAEEIRDSALFASGLLVERFGGKSVRPYQPSGLWEAVAYPISTTAKYERDDGDGLWRRSVYTFWKRTQPPAAMQVFDAPTREACTVRRARTNTPLQALALLNDEQWTEAARALAMRALRAAGSDDERVVEQAFRLVVTRAPDEREREVLLRLLERARARFRARPEEARAQVAIGEAPRDAEVDVVELAAWTSVARAILNLDEAVTRG